MSDPFLINSTQGGLQGDPTVLPTSDGGFIVIWENDATRDGTAVNLSARRVDAEGQPIGSDVVLQQATGQSLRDPMAVALPDGSFVLVWHDGTASWAAVYDDDLSQRVAPFRLDTGSAAGNMSVTDLAATADGGFVLSYSATSGGETEQYVQSFSATGTADGPAVQVSGAPAIAVGETSRIITLEDGNTVVAWLTEAASGAEAKSLRATILGPDGQIIRADFPLSFNIEAEANDFDLLALDGGGFVAAYRRPDGLAMVFHDAGGARLGPADGVQSGLIVPNGRISEDYDFADPIRITQLETGQLTVVWKTSFRTYESEDYQAGGWAVFKDNVYGTTFTATGQLMSASIISPVYTDRPFEGGGSFDLPRETFTVQALADGGVVVVYHDWVASGSDPSVEDLQVMARIFGRGTSGDDDQFVIFPNVFMGFGGDDALSGGLGNEFIDGGAGNDSLRASDGNDTLLGGEGNDTFRGEPGNDIIDGGPGEDTIIFNPRDPGTIHVDLALTGWQEIGIDDGLDWLIGIEHLQGSYLTRDTFKGNDAANRLDGGLLGDLLIGRNGNDTLIGERGDDTLQGDNGDDFLLGGRGRDTAVYSGSQDVTVDLRLTGPQNTGRGFDTLASIENLIGGSGNDLLQGDNLRNQLEGGDGADTLRGAAGPDLLIGNAGSDVLIGGNGADTLIGGAGDDRLIGNAGPDTFAFNAFSGNDRILDFEPGTDVIRIDVVDPDNPGATVTVVGDHVLVEWAGGRSVLVKDVDALGSDDLIFV